MPEQLDHYQNKFNLQKFPVILICDSLNSAANQGALFRIGDAFGIEKIVFCGTEPQFTRRMQKTARSTEKKVLYTYQEHITTAVKEAREKGYEVVSIEITDNSLPLENVQFNPDKKYALVLGSENFGIQQEIISQSDLVVHITMYGENSSMNVGNATAIALYELCKQLNSNQ